jgi:outer membrane protein OmpA-like peptidoglycan-associated protein
MKIAIVGFLVFCGWTTGSTYIYVCLLKGLCDEPMEMTILPKPPEARNLEPIAKEDAVTNNLTIYFAYDKFDFTADIDTDKYISQTLDYLTQNPTARLILVGHADERGTEAYNQKLGLQRAERIRKYAEDKGLATNQITSSSRGEMVLADTNKTKIGYAHNRRVALTIKQ